MRPPSPSASIAQRVEVTSPVVDVADGQTRPPRRGLDRFELAMLALFAALSLWVAGWDFVKSLSSDLVWTHTDSFFSGDQLQYLAWIQSSARHVLVSDMYVLRHTPADYFQPAVALSGLLVRAGVAAWLALLLWKPVAVLAVFFAVRAVAHRCFARRFDRRAMLVLGLFYASLTSLYGSLGVFGDTMIVWLTWGYSFGLIAVALAVFALLGYARARDSGTVVWWPGALGGLAAMLHPWQGELLILLLAAAELVRARQTIARLRAAAPAARRPRAVSALASPELALPLVTLLLIAIPLLYYVGLEHLDPVWRAGQHQSRHTFTWTAVVIAMAPLAVFTALGYRGRPADFFELLMRLWLPVAVFMWLLALTSIGASPQHSVTGLSIPMAMLAVTGVRRTSRPRLRHAPAIACAAIVIGTVPATVYAIVYAPTYIAPTPGNANWITRSESDALHYLTADPTPGGVLTTYYLGAAVPGITGRQAFVGNCLWSEPRCQQRDGTVRRMFNHRMTAAAARAFVQATGARFILEGCDVRTGLGDRLGPLLVSARRFGCARLYQVRVTGPPRGPLASVSVRAASGSAHG